MSQSFNRIRRLFFSLWVNPFMGPLLAGSTIPAALALLTGDVWWLSLAFLWALGFFLLERAAARGRPQWLAMGLTPHFYAVRSMDGRYGIFERRVKSGHGTDCKSLLRSLAEEQRRLPAALPPGRYRALTHDIVLRRLREIESARDIVAVPVYTATLAHIRTEMTGGRCKRCKKRCPFPTVLEASRQFYLVLFTIDDFIDTTPNTTLVLCNKK